MSDAAVPDQVNVVVRDMEATVAFYRRLGLSITDTIPRFHGHHRAAETPEGGVHLEFDSVTFARHWHPGSSGGMVVLGFKVQSRDRVDEVYADLVGAGYRGRREPFDAFWGARYAIVADPDGNAVGIMSPIDADCRSDPGFP